MPPRGGSLIPRGEDRRRHAHDVFQRSLAGIPTTVLAIAEGSAAATSTITPASSSTISVAPLFPSPTSTPSPSATSDTSNRHTISQTVLMWVFAVIALGLLTIMVIWRYAWMKIHNMRRPLHQQQQQRSGGGLPRSLSGRIIRDSDFVNSWDRETRPIALSPSFFHTDTMPIVDHRGVQINGPRGGGARAVRALDVDAGGRRVGGGPSSDDGDDDLPVYEAGKGPPGYEMGPVVEQQLAPPGLLHQNAPRSLSPRPRPREREEDNNTPQTQQQTGALDDSPARHEDQPHPPSDLPLSPSSSS